jgi:hypothetical protein
VASCGGVTPPDFGDGGGGDGSSTGDGSTKGDGSSGGDGSIGMCPSGNFPMYDKGCTTTDNCSFGLHQVDCCGTLSAIGFNHAFKTAFDAAEVTWRASCPGCGCPSGPTKVESGVTCDQGKIGVKCDTSGTGSNGKCTTVCN